MFRRARKIIANVNGGKTIYARIFHLHVIVSAGVSVHGNGLKIFDELNNEAAVCFSEIETYVPIEKRICEVCSKVRGRCFKQVHKIDFADFVIPEKL